jgi:hypothetical protein
VLSPSKGSYVSHRQDTPILGKDGRP